MHFHAKALARGLAYGKKLLEMAGTTPCASVKAWTTA